jgi:hypothetical protein
MWSASILSTFLLAAATSTHASSAYVGSEVFAGVAGKCHTAAMRLAYKTTFSECADTAGLITVFGTAQGSITKPFQKWLNGFCNEECSPRVLNYTHAILDGGCSNELENEVTTAVRRLCFGRRCIC